MKKLCESILNSLSVTEMSNATVSGSAIAFQCTKMVLGDSLRKPNNLEKLFKCDECDHTSFNNREFKRHVFSVHKQVKEFKCSESYYPTPRNSHLKRHVLIVHEN